MTFTGVPGVMPCAAPSSSVSPAATPLVISTRSVASSRMPSVTSTTLGLAVLQPRARPASRRADRPPPSATVSALSRRARHAARRVEIRRRDRCRAFGMRTYSRTCRVCGSALGYTFVIVP